MCQQFVREVGVIVQNKLHTSESIEHLKTEDLEGLKLCTMCDPGQTERRII
jgi:hypothetical protein